MVKNTGKPSEEAFEKVWARLGKRAWLHRLVDAAEVKGRTGRADNIRAAPSDYIVAHKGVHFAEVKSTQDATAFRFNLLRPKPSAMAVQIVAAGGDYWVYVHRLLTNDWYRLPYALITTVKDAGQASIPWTKLEGLKWNFPT